MKVNQIDISKDMKVSDLVAQFEASDVLGAGRVARATNILANMIKDEDTNVFMSLGGPLIPGGMRNIVSQMIREGHVDLIVSSGANLTHDLLEAFGGAHYRDEGKDDEELNAEGIGRIADINVGSNDFEVFEKDSIFVLISLFKIWKSVYVDNKLQRNSIFKCKVNWVVNFANCGRRVRIGINNKFCLIFNNRFNVVFGICNSLSVKFKQSFCFVCNLANFVKV